MTRIVMGREPIDPVKIVRNKTVQANWKRLWDCCWWCQRNDPGHYDLHHIVGNPNRSDELCNFSFFCREHHKLIESLDALSSVKVAMEFKRLRDRENYDKLRVEALFGRRLDQ